MDLRATYKSTILGPLGIPIHGWFFTVVEEIDPVFSKKLHDEAIEKPFTISTLLDDDGLPLGPGRVLFPGERCWIRITSISKEMSDVLRKILKLFRAEKKTVRIYKMKFHIHDQTTNPRFHPLARETSYPEIAQNEKYRDPFKKIKINFTSPTAFRSHQLDLPLPIPDLVFNSYIKKWNLYCTHPHMKFEDEWVDFLRATVKIDQIYTLQTYEWKISSNKKDRIFPGFIGKVAFSLARREKISSDYSFWRDNFAVVEALSDYSFYCGTGQHATFGMGQTQIW